MGILIHNVVLQEPNALIKINDGTICVRLLSCLNPTLSEKTSMGSYFNPLIDKSFYIGTDVYKVKTTEGVVGYPERMAQMVTATKLKKCDTCNGRGYSQEDCHGPYVCSDCNGDKFV